MPAATKNILLKLIDDEDCDVIVRNGCPEPMQFGKLAAVHLPIAILGYHIEPVLVVRRQPQRLSGGKPEFDPILRVDLR